MLNKVQVLILLGILLLICGIGVAVAAYYVYSPVQHKDVTEKAIGLTVSLNGREVTFTATGVKPSAPVQFGTTTANPATDASFTVLHTSTADATGEAVWTYTAAVASYDYVARADNTNIP